MLMRTKAAIARLRAYKPPPFPVWDRLPVSRRAAVLMLLYADRKGDLRVVITMRAASLRSFSGHAALPGGKADSIDETPYQIARREASEEIGLPQDDVKIPAPFRIEHLCDLPASLARTELAVRPCVALLHATDPPVAPGPVLKTPSVGPTVEESLIPRLDAKEVAAVFSASFHNFLRMDDEAADSTELPPGKWYEGNWVTWNDEQWRMNFFYVPVTDQVVTKPRPKKGVVEEREGIDDSDETEVEEHPGRYKVWGMTARMLVDAARIAYGEDPEFEHNIGMGDEEMITNLEKLGRLGPKKKGDVVVATRRASISAEDGNGKGAKM
ncbi:NUDIX hydrolase domain-like protein [Apodospora peruviana]|uniref:NUDIX hydrolase domain-like protein n=1 Tax=Apodospora peruviana TaxID=516989 RepID=A0AAE0IQT2_9PEZI|nr:NUDIX hydrolase domain-like protein [Apodospora peruviana]